MTRGVLLVGHGPSIFSGLGALIDEFTVVRLKSGYRGPQQHWGTRTDFLVCRPTQCPPGIPCWPYIPILRAGWKDSHGLAAAKLAVANLHPPELWVIGYDRLMGDLQSPKFNGPMPVHVPHDWAAEHAQFFSLGVPIRCLTSLSSIPSPGSRPISSGTNPISSTP